MTNYQEKLKDPRWQKKRLEVFERDEWKCRCCEETSDTLHIHHLVYLKGLEPWEYHSGLLLTLCSQCHSQVSSDYDDEKSSLSGMMDEVGLFFDMFWRKGFCRGDFIDFAYELSKIEKPKTPSILIDIELKLKWKQIPERSTEEVNRNG